MPYHIPPAPALSDPDIMVTKAFTPDQADGIRVLSEEHIDKRPEVAKVGFNEYLYMPDRRICTVSWLPFPESDPRTEWVYRAVTDAVQHANASFWQYDLWGFYDMLHCLRYTETGHFEWHQDRGDKSLRPQRKLSFSVLLSNPDEYEGGDFQIFDKEPRTIAAKDKGTIIIFPSFIYHRVTPVTSGIRHALVGWVCGPKFK